MKYPGSKWRIADRLVQMIPEHHAYCEPFFGSGAVFFKKNPSDIEMINDLDNDIPNLFMCIRDDPDKLAAIVASIPYSRYEYEKAFSAGGGVEPYTKAAKFLTRCWQGHGFRTNGPKVGWKNDVHGRESMYALRDWYNLPGNIIETAERLRCVQIENRPATEVIKRFNYPDVFMYIDPPYLLSTRTGKQYKHEMSEEEHKNLLDILKASRAKIMLSGYESDIYNEALKGWHKEYFTSNTGYSSSSTEVVWMNYSIQLTIQDFQQELF